MKVSLCITVLAAAAVGVASAVPAWAQVTGDPANKHWWLKPGAARAAKGTDGDFPGGFGAKASAPAAFRSHPRFVIRRAARGERPASLLLTQYLPPVDTQGKQGSCAAWATAYYNYTYCVAKRRKWDPARLEDPRYRFSPAFLYNQLRDDKGDGISVSAAFDMLTAKGCATLAEMPYTDTDSSAVPSPDAVARAKRFTAERAGLLFGSTEPFDAEKLKTFLSDARQPFVLVMPVFSDFPRTSVTPDFVYEGTAPQSPESLHGTHAVAIIGYDDAKRAFRMVNSWGTKWGDNGYLWLSESFLKSHAAEGWSVVPGGVAARGVTDGGKTAPRVQVAAPVGHR